jgi:germination protein M
MNRILSLVAAGLLLAACGGSTGDLGSVATPPPSEEPSIELPSDEPTPGQSAGPSQAPSQTPGSSTETTTIRAYFFLGSFVDNAGLVPVLREIPKTPAVGAAAMAALIAGPMGDELEGRPAMYTTIPDGTRFLGLTIDGGVATVNLSKEFDTGGGSASVLGRLAQVVYTLTQFPTVKSVQFELDGEPATVFSGEGVLVDRPVGRDDYTKQLPAIFVDRPAWGGVLANPARLAGMANVFEAQFRFRILDAEGRSLAAGPVRASCGTGCWGTFDVTVPYTVGAAGWGTLHVFEPSAKDGSETNMTDYPVWLTP